MATIFYLVIILSISPLLKVFLKELPSRYQLAVDTLPLFLISYILGYLSSSRKKPNSNRIVRLVQAREKIIKSFPPDKLQDRLRKLDKKHFGVNEDDELKPEKN